MSWRKTLGRTTQPNPSTQNEHNPQKPDHPHLSADCADIAQDDKESKLLEVLADACRGMEIEPAEVMSELSEVDIEAWKRREISADTLATFASALVDRRMMDQGKRPAHYTEKAYCQQCGPVYLWSSGAAIGCPWCFNRAAGRPIPRPGSVRCGECHHFERVSYHPHLGNCTLGEPEAIAGLWDSDRRYCLHFIPHPQHSTDVRTGTTETKTKS